MKRDTLRNKAVGFPVNRYVHCITRSKRTDVSQYYRTPQHKRVASTDSCGVARRTERPGPSGYMWDLVNMAQAASRFSGQVLSISKAEVWSDGFVAIVPPRVASA